MGLLLICDAETLQTGMLRWIFFDEYGQIVGELPRFDVRSDPGLLGIVTGSWVGGVGVSEMVL